MMKNDLYPLGDNVFLILSERCRKISVNGDVCPTHSDIKNKMKKYKKCLALGPWQKHESGFFADVLEMWTTK